MAQKDTKALMELATESKKDSSTMKTIALLGMVFLPGTFISVSFLGPLSWIMNSDFENRHKGNTHILFRHFSRCPLSIGTGMVLLSSSQVSGTTGRLLCRLLFSCYWYGHWQGCCHINHNGLRDSDTVGICQARVLRTRWRWHSPWKIKP